MPQDEQDTALVADAMTQRRKREMRIPVECWRCGRALGWCEDVPLIAICEDCMDKPLETRVLELERRVKKLEGARDDH